MWGSKCDGEWDAVTEARVPLAQTHRDERSNGGGLRVRQANERLTRLRCSLIGVDLDGGAGWVHRRRLTDKWAEGRGA